MRVRTGGLLLLSVLALHSQDAGLVLSTSVSYSTLAATSELKPETRAEVDRLRGQAMLASRAGRHGEALRYLHRGMALMEGIDWTPEVARAASVVLRSDHAVWEPGQTVRIRLDELYQPEKEAFEPLLATVRLQRLHAGTVLQLKQTAIDHIPWETSITVPLMPAGRYRLEVSVPPVRMPKQLNIAFASGIRKRAEKLQSRISKLKVKEGPGLWTAQYAVELYERADRSEVSPEHYDFDRELRWGEQVAAALESRRDPFAGRVGDMRRAYRSNVDKQLQPYRIYVPSGYKSDERYPLIVALHGMGGDENSLFDRYNSFALKNLAEKYGYFVAAPKGREPASMYRGPAEQDVIDVIAEARAAYRIDANRIYLMGHSMGAYGTWSIAMNYPDLFAALAPVAGGGNPTGMQKIRHIPQLVVHGENDKTVPVRSSRVMVEAARQLGAEIEYIEVKGGGHNEVFVPAIPRMFEFFSRHRKP